MQEKETEKMWGGRFRKEPDPMAASFTRSLEIDYPFWSHDLLGSLAHARMLGITGIIPLEEANLIVQGLLDILNDMRSGAITLDSEAEDIHTFIEAQLYERIGPAAGKLHTGRSRNDQVVTDVRLWLKESISGILNRIFTLQSAILEVAIEHLTTVMPGLTHQQHAQPVTLAHHLLAYFWMLNRDYERFAQNFHRTNSNPLGAAALAGSSLPLDRVLTTSELDFAEVIPNSMDAVSDRDFLIEFQFNCSLLMVHLSRLAQELILWSAPEYGFVELDDAYTTGSSIMPQKKNPDVMELIRGRSARTIGNLTAMLTMLKALPLTYHRDLQDDKILLLDTVSIVSPALSLTAGVLKTAQWNVERMRQATYGDYSTATELANYLVRKGMPFREAHGVIGRLVLSCSERRKPLEELRLEELQAYSPLFAEDALGLPAAEQAVSACETEGGTSPTMVAVQIEIATGMLKRRQGMSDEEDDWDEE
jgi:argininosuccinate lyase